MNEENWGEKLDRVEEIVQPAAPVVHQLDELREAHKTEKTRAELQRREAFEGEFFWRGEVLHGLSYRRKARFLAHRGALSCAPLAVLAADKYSLAEDAARLLFFCSHMPEDWLKYTASPEMLEELIQSWADQAIAPFEILDAIEIFEKMWNASEVSQYATRGGQSSGN